MKSYNNQDQDQDQDRYIYIIAYLADGDGPPFSPALPGIVAGQDIIEDLEKEMFVSPCVDGIVWYGMLWYGMGRAKECSYP